jgi:hypothetical protein
MRRGADTSPGANPPLRIFSYYINLPNPSYGITRGMYEAGGLAKVGEGYG